MRVWGFVGLVKRGPRCGVGGRADSLLPRRFGLVALTLVAVALLAWPGHEPRLTWAQQPAQGDAAGQPQTIRGELTEQSRRTPAGRYAELHTIEVPNAWTAGTISYAVAGFRPSFVLSHPNLDGIELTPSEPPRVEENDDGDAIHRGQLRFVARNAGRHHLLVTSAHEEQTGRYHLRIRYDENPYLDVASPQAVQWPGRDGEAFLRRFRLDVADDARSVIFELSGSRGDADLHVQHGEPLESLSDLSQSTWKATTPDGEERLVLDAHSDPPLRPGTLYVYLPLWNEQGRPSAGPDEAELLVSIEWASVSDVEHEVQRARLGKNAGALHGELPRRGGRYVQAWRYTGAAGDRIEFDVRSDAFDATLRLISDGQAFESSGRSDDDPNPRLVHEFTRDGEEVRLEVSSRRAAAAVGEYTLGVYHDGATYSAPWTLEPGIFKGQLCRDDERLRSGEHADWYAVEAQAGDILAVSLVSYQFDGYLFVQSPGGARYDNERRSRADRNPFSRFSVGESGRVRIGVSTVEPDRVGTYRLYVERMTSPVLGGVALSTLELGEVETGTLGPQSPRLPDGRFARRYRLSLEYGEGVRVAMVSTDVQQLDPALIVTAPDGLRIENEAAHAETRSPIVEFRAHLPGTYYVTATGTRAGMQGTYHLRAVRRTATLTPTVPAAAPSEQPRRYWGIFAGVSEYDSEELERLPLCREDAKRIARAYRDTGVMTSHQQIVLLDEECSAESIRFAFERLATQVAPGDVFVFFFSGHGGRSAPGDYPNQINNRREAIVASDASWIYDDQFAGMLDMLHEEALKVIVLDACFSGGFARQVISAPNRAGFFSSEMDLTSSVAPSLEFGGYLSAFFYQAVTGAADLDGDGKITVGELKDFLFVSFAKAEAEARDPQGNRTRQTLVYDRGAVPPNAPFLRLRD